MTHTKDSSCGQAGDPKIIIIGSGPTGLGAATRLTELEKKNWHLYDGADTPGGLSRTFKDAKGFLWDVGGHVIFSHYQYFDDVMNYSTQEWNELQRESWVRLSGVWVPYPFQNNIHRLPAEDRDRCLAGMEIQDRIRSEAEKNGESIKINNFEEYIDSTFGEGIANLFMRPYNFKVWAVPPAIMNTEWLGERVSVPNVSRIRENINLKRDDVGWGPNATFRYPVQGGTGGIYLNLFNKLPPINFSVGNSTLNIKDINVDEKKMTLQDGKIVPYDYIISTMPLDDLLRMVNSPSGKIISPEQKKRFLEVADKMTFSSTHVIGLGIKGDGPPPEISTACWMYFPEDNTPFYRATIFSNYSSNNAPKGHWSLMLEVSESPYKPVKKETIAKDCINGCINAGLLRKEDVVVSEWHQTFKKGYPIPFLGRNELLQEVLPILKDKCNIYSRGRFGAWKYEVANQDHSLMQGVEAVNAILGLSDEVTLFNPNKVNTAKQTEKCTLLKS